MKWKTFKFDWNFPDFPHSHLFLSFIPGLSNSFWSNETMVLVIGIDVSVGKGKSYDHETQTVKSFSFQKIGEFWFWIVFSACISASAVG